MSVPAHANLDSHGDKPGLRIDCFEDYFGYDYFWNADAGDNSTINIPSDLNNCPLKKRLTRIMRYI
jgi:hypothetical protein